MLETFYMTVLYKNDDKNLEGKTCAIQCSFILPPNLPKQKTPMSRPSMMDYCGGGAQRAGHPHSLPPRQNNALETDYGE